MLRADGSSNRSLNLLPLSRWPATLPVPPGCRASRDAMGPMRGAVVHDHGDRQGRLDLQVKDRLGDLACFARTHDGKRFIQRQDPRL